MAISRKQFTTQVGNKTLTLEVSSIAGQTNAAVIARYGETAVLATVVMTEKDAQADYLPLRVDYEERFYAAGKIIGSRFIRREGRPSEDAILSGRLVDRVIRPLFDQRLRREIQVVVTVLAYDEENDPDFVGLMAASAALTISDIPWGGPVSGVRIVRTKEGLLVNPDNSIVQKSDIAFETFVAGPEGTINMIELGGNEAQEEGIEEAFAAAQREIDALIQFERSIGKEIGKPKTPALLYEPDATLRARVDEFLAPRIRAALYESGKTERNARLDALKAELFLHLAGEYASSGETADLKAAEHLFSDAIDDTLHRAVLGEGRRPDGREPTEIRELEAEAGLFKRTHGSALFMRGTTQSLAVTTLAPPGAEQLIETMETTGKRRFMLHYNFPPYSVGETGIFRGPGRREIGHGALAEKALRPVIPGDEAFPYTIRVVSEILSSNGSSSMATVCASSLSLMDAGVPLKKAVAGIAMGLLMDYDDEKNFRVLTDIQGPEDRYGDMDFKVAGTEEGVTAIQLDVKVKGLTREIIEAALRDAKAARLKILAFMKTVLPAPRHELPKSVPAVLQLRINTEKIGLVIGPGGKMINGLIKRYGLASIDIEDDGRVYVAGTDLKNAEEAAQEIKLMTRDFTVGEVLTGRVVRILDFGAIVDLGGGMDGMVHVSELKNGFVKNVSDVVRIGDIVRAKVIRADEDGKIGLSMKQAEKE